MPHLLCIGDSITDCSRLYSDSQLGNGYVSMIAKKLRPQWQITNKGTDGFTLQRLLQNVPAYLSLCPDVISILIGINDIALMMNTNRTSFQQQQMMEQFSENYRQFLDQLSGSKARLILMEPFVFPCPAYLRCWMPLLHTMSHEIREIAGEYQIPFIFLQEPLHAEAALYGYDRITTDGVHLTSQGHEVIASALLPYLSADQGVFHT